MISKRPKTLVVIVGPTAIGKTALSIAVAKALHSPILSCDSRQFYKEMKIGTAVPSEEELAAVQHYGIQNRSIFEDYNVGQFESDTLELLTSLFHQHDALVMVGGSGLYVDAVTKGLDFFPEVAPNIREQLSTMHKEQGITPLQKQLQDLDPETYATIDLENPHRVIRALEICIGTGKPFSSFKQKETNKRPFNTLIIGLTGERSIVYDRINQRVDIMIEQGLVDEAKALYPHKDLNALQTVGYKEIFHYFDGHYTLEEAIAEIKKNTRRFAKRQGTWFRKNKEIQWFDFTTPYPTILEYINSKL